MSLLDDIMGGDMKCTKCSWTRFTGGMDEDMHESLGHGPLVKANQVPPSAPVKKCKNCGIKEKDAENFSITQCIYHPGKKDDWKRMMAPGGAHVTFTWSCCNAKYDYTERSKVDENVHKDGCKRNITHDFE